MNAIFVGGNLNGLETTVDEIMATCWNGRLSPDLSAIRARGGLVWRAELDNCPLVDGYLQPMWDGDKLRYETQEYYDMLSR